MLKWYIENWPSQAKRALHVMALSLGIILIFWLITGEPIVLALIIPAMILANIAAIFGKDD